MYNLLIIIRHALRTFIISSCHVKREIRVLLECQPNEVGLV